jgi:hypothetical protein
MCNCICIPCQGCQYPVPVHIADFCVPGETIETRCAKCPPPEAETGWVAFDRDPGVIGCPHEATLYLRYVGDPGEMPTGYGVSDEGDITPNTAEHRERIDE